MGWLNVFGIPAVILAWLAYFTSSWTKAFPEIQAILAADRSGGGTFNVTTTTPSSSEEEDPDQYDIISDEEEDYLDDILFQTLMYEKFFIGCVTFVLIFSVAYFIIRIVHKPLPDESPYEIILDFIFHVLSALGLLTGGALVLLSAAKIQSFVDKIVNKDLPPAVLEIIKNGTNEQDKAEKIAAGAIGMFNGILYALCVVTLRMTHPIECKQKKRQKHLRRFTDLPRFSVVSLGVLDSSRKDSIVSYGTPVFYME